MSRPIWKCKLSCLKRSTRSGRGGRAAASSFYEISDNIGVGVTPAPVAVSVIVAVPPSEGNDRGAVCPPFAVAANATGTVPLPFPGTVCPEQLSRPETMENSDAFAPRGRPD